MSRITHFSCYFLSLKLASVLSYYAFPSLLVSCSQLLNQVFTPALRISKGRWGVPLSNDIIPIHSYQGSRVYSVRGAHSEAESSILPGAFVWISHSKKQIIFEKILLFFIVFHGFFIVFHHFLTFSWFFYLSGW